MGTTAIVVVSILSILLITGILVILNILKKLEIQEQILSSYLLYLNNLSKIIELSDEKLKKLDLNGSFESDDEIGFFFKNIKELQKIMNEFKLKN